MDIAEIIRAAGGPSRVGREIGRSHATVIGWERVPPHHVRKVAQLAGLTPFDLRPDLYDAPAPAGAAQVASRTA